MTVEYEMFDVGNWMLDKHLGGMLPSLRDFLFRLHELPSHKWLGYFREIGKASDDSTPYSLNPASRLENSPALQRWVQRQKISKVPQGRPEINQPIPHLRKYLIFHKISQNFIKFRQKTPPPPMRVSSLKFSVSSFSD